MKTLLLLNDKPADSAWLLPDAVSGTSPRPEPVAGCNCDRWGHRCPGCVTHSLEPKRRSRPQNRPRNEV